MSNIVEDYSGKIPKYLGGTYVGRFDCNDNCQLILIKDTNKANYDDYLQRLLEFGFEEYDAHTMMDNYYVTYIYKNAFVLHTYFTSSDRRTRIIIDPNTNLYNRKQDVTDLATGNTTLYQMELDHRNINCGMCYITQCNDGSFFIIDSAHMFSKNDHIRIYNLLKTLTPKGEEIIIAGWFLSHAHQDHIAKFMDFIEAGFPNCKIEQLYYNFPALTVDGAEKWHDYDKDTMREFESLIKKHNELSVVKLHSGQRFFVRNLQLEVLLTHEDIYPHNLARYNNASTVLLMTIEDYKVIFLADASLVASNILCERYGAYMKSDIVQISHHGFDGGTPQLYDYIGAKIVLFPTNQFEYEQNLYREANKKAVEISKEVYVSGNGTVSLPLPYKEGTAKVYQQEVN